LKKLLQKDLALTRKGFKRVLWSGQSGEKPVVNLDPLSVTKDHKILIDGEWKSIEEIECQKDSEKNRTPCCLTNQPYLKALSITDIRNQNEGKTKFITKVGEKELKLTSILQFTKAITGVFQRGFEVHQKDENLLTTPLMVATTNCYQLESTAVHHAPWALVGRGEPLVKQPKKIRRWGCGKTHYCPVFKKEIFAALSVDTTLTMNFRLWFRFMTAK